MGKNRNNRQGFLKNSFIDIPTVYPFEVYNSLIFSISADICGHYHSFRTFSLP